jgi:predicted metal-dependent hydrolase
MELRQFEDLKYILQKSPHRKTLGLTIERDGQIIVSAPEVCNDRVIEKMLAKRRFWIYTKLAEQERLTAMATHREFASGQGFLYLGRSYRLRLVSVSEAVEVGQTQPLRWHQGHFHLLKSELENGHEHFRQWYTERSRAKLAERVALHKPRIQVEPVSLRVTDLGYRWGSCGRDRVLRFNWRLIMAPIRIVDYVVVHELLHIAAPNHTPEYWKLFHRAMPDFLERKQWLAEHGAEFSL